MTQTIVNFLVAGGLDVNNIPTSFTLQPRVFDFEISSAAQAYYTFEMNQLQAALQAINPSNPAANDAQIVTISKILQNLSNWSKLKFSTSGSPDQSYMAGSNVIQVITVDNAGNALPFNQIKVNGVLQMNGAQPMSATDYFTANPGDKTPLFSPPDSGTPLNSTMDRYMAEQVDQLLRTFRSAVDPNAPANTPPWDPILSPANTLAQVNDAMRHAVVALTSVATQPIYDVAGVITRAISTAAQARIIGDATTGSQSIQQLLMVDYVSRGNDLLFDEMSKLRDAIDINQTALSYLNSLQDLMNQKDPQKFVLQLQLLNTVHTATGADNQSLYDTFESETYNTALTTISKATDANLQAYIDSLGSTPNPTDPAQDPLARGAFEELANAMQGVFTYSINIIKVNIQYVIDQLNAKAGNQATSLRIPLQTILQDFQMPDQSIEKWIQDAQEGSAGDYQRHLNNAIVASQSFNDTQRENLRNVMFTFEEFYKSATALLSRITQLIEKMAGSIAR